jgi:hypothetical protein
MAGEEVGTNVVGGSVATGVTVGVLVDMAAGDEGTVGVGKNIGTIHIPSTKVHTPINRIPAIPSPIQIRLPRPEAGRA